MSELLKIHRTSSADETKALAEKLAKKLAALSVKGPLVLDLKGTLGAGKTTFAQGFIGEWQRLFNSPPSHVPSPTFNMCRVYLENDRLHRLAHFDLYRMKNVEEVFELGFPDYFLTQMHCLVWEWLDLFPEIRAFFKDLTVYQVELKPSDLEHRDIEIRQVS